MVKKVISERPWRLPIGGGSLVPGGWAVSVAVGPEDGTAGVPGSAGVPEVAALRGGASAAEGAVQPTSTPSSSVASQTRKPGQRLPRFALPGTEARVQSRVTGGDSPDGPGEVLTLLFDGGGIGTVAQLIPLARKNSPY